MKSILFYLSAALLIFWGIAHLFPTRSVVKGFGKITTDNERIIMMEWIVEGLSLIFLGILIAVVTFFDAVSWLSFTIYWLCVGMLVVLTILSFFTGFKVSFLPYKLCPVIFLSSALLILLGIYW